MMAITVMMGMKMATVTVHGVDDNDIGVDSEAVGGDRDHDVCVCDVVDGNGGGEDQY